MKKRIISLLTAAVIFFGLFGCLTTAQTVKQVFSVSLQNNITNGYVNTTSLKFKVSAAQNSGSTRIYKITATYQGKTITKDLECASGSSANTVIDIEALQGNCDLETVITYNNEEVYRYNKSFVVIRQYQKQFMDSISKRGINGADNSNLNYYNLMGLQTSRISWEWGWTEKSFGVYNWPSTIGDLLNAGSNPIFLACYGNSLYNGGKADKTGPTTKREIDAFAAYAADAAKKYPNIRYYEIWNEPNIQFWLPKPNVYDYVNLLEVTSHELKKINEDYVIIGAAIASSDYDYATKMFNLNAAASMDSFATHPYCYPSYSDIYVADQMDEYEKRVLEHGGWQIKVSTEFGWPTNTGYRGVSQDMQAEELVKHFAIADYNEYEIDQVYRMDDLAINGSHDPSYNEDNFGVINYDKTPKPAVLSIKTMNEMTNGGIPAGMLEVPYGVSAYLYVKDKEVTAVIWRNARTNGATPSELAFDENVTVYDMNGNLISTGHTVPVTGSPVYVKGISGDTLAKAMKYNLRKKFDRKLSMITSFNGIYGLDSMKSLLYGGADSMSLANLPNETDAKNKLNTYYNDVLGGMINLYKNRGFKGSEEQLASLLYIAHLGGIKIMPLYMLSVNSAPTGNELTDAQNNIAYAKKMIKDKANGGTLLNSSRILKYASEIYKNLETVFETPEQNQMKNGMIKGWSEMIANLTSIAVKMSEVETVAHENILVQMPSTQLDFTIGTRKDAIVSFYNYSDRTVSGVIEIVDPSGRVAGISQEVSLEAGKSMEVPVSTMFIRNCEEGEISHVRFKSNGKVWKSVQVPVIVTGTDTSSGEYKTYYADLFDNNAVDYEYQWKYSNDGINYYSMEFANQSSYKVTTIDKNRNIACEVTPIYADGSKGEPQLQEKGIVTKLGPIDVTWISAADRFNTRFTPDEYKFKIEGTRREYSLLDVFEGETSSRYFVLSDFLTGNVEQHNKDPQNINPADPDSIGYWLNNIYVNTGYELAGVNWPKLEEQMYQYIDKNHRWWVEAGIKGTEADDADGYGYTAALGLLTESESIKYLGRYGWNVKTENNEWYNPWILATGSAGTNRYIQVTNFSITDADHVYNSGEHYLNNVTPGTKHGELYPRPAFYLNDDFFKNVRLDIPTLGSEVKKIIRENYTKKELSEIYSEDELRQIGYTNDKLEIKRFTASNGITSAKVDVPDIGGNAYAAIYDADNRCAGIKQLGNNDYSVKFEQEARKIKLFLWEDLISAKPLLKAEERIF